MRKFLLLLLTVLFISVFQINAKDFDELIGKTVIINVADEALSPYVYTYEALEKNKFKREFLADPSIVNTPIVIKDVTQKKKFLNITIGYNNQNLVLHLPLEEPRYNYWFDSSDYLTYKGFGIKLPFFDYELIDDIETLQNNFSRPIIIPDKNTSAYFYFLEIYYDREHCCFIAKLKESGSDDNSYIYRRLKDNSEILDLKKELLKGIHYENPVSQPNNNVIRF